MAHAIWSGAINFGLVNIPVRLFSAVRAKELRFHLLHARDSGRIHNERVCEVCGEKVAWDELVRGFEYEKGSHVTLTDEDLKKASPEATQSITIQEFVDLGEIDPIYFATPYYLEPDKRGRHAYALLREALKQSGKVGIARVVIRTREHLAAVRPKGDMLVLELMHWADEVLPASALDLPKEGAAKMPAPEMKAAQMLIDTMSGKFEPGEFHDHYREQLMEVIDARAHGAEIAARKPTPRPDNVLDLMDVLQRSLRESQKGAAGAARGAAKKDAAAPVEAKGPKETPRGAKRPPKPRRGRPSTKRTTAA